MKKKLRNWFWNTVKSTLKWMLVITVTVTIYGVAANAFAASGIQDAIKKGYGVDTPLPPNIGKVVEQDKINHPEYYQQPPDTPWQETVKKANPTINESAEAAKKEAEEAAEPQSQKSDTQKHLEELQKKNKAARDNERKNAIFPVRYFGDAVYAMSDALVKAGFYTIDQLVFGYAPDDNQTPIATRKENPRVQLFETSKDGKTTEFDAIAPIYWGFFGVGWMMLIGVGLFAGVRIAKGKSNPKVRGKIWEVISNFLVGIVFLTFAWLIVYYISEWNLLFCRWLAPYSVPPATGMTEAAVTTGDYALSSLITLVLTGMSLFFNILYTLRKFLLIGAILMGIFVGVAYAAGNKKPLSIWLPESITNGLMPFSHAIVFGVYFRLYLWSMKNGSGMMSTWWVPIVVLFFIIPVSQGFRKLFSSFTSYALGTNEEAVAAGGVAGLTGLAGMAATGASLLGGGAKGSMSGLGSLGSKVFGKSSTSSGSVSPNLNAGAVERGLGSNLATGIGTNSPLSTGAAEQALPGLAAMAQTTQSFGEKAGVAGAAFGRGAGALLGAGLDMGVRASGGRGNFNFAGGFAKAGEKVGGLAGQGVGKIGGGAWGLHQGVKQQQAMAKQTNGPFSSRSERVQAQNPGYKTALRQSLGFDRPQPTRTEYGANNKAASWRTTGQVASAMSIPGAERFGNWMANKSISKGLESSGNLKSR